MNILEKKMVETLKDLKENHHVVGIKAEFETEGTNLEEALKLKEITEEVNLDLTIKIGGCGAIRDMNDVKMIGANIIVAPMVESVYAVQKFLQSLKMVFTDEEQNGMKFFINIETINGFNCLDEILKSDFSKKIKGIALGRTDMVGSLKMEKDKINHDEIFKYAKEISKKTQKYNKEFIIGGGVSDDSLLFFKNLPYISKFETRKIIFDAEKALKSPNIEEGIIKAFEFELMWLKNKKELYGKTFIGDEIRFKTLKIRYQNSIKETIKTL